jgi:hypothetical protein
MNTASKVLVGTAVVAGAYFVYKLALAPKTTTAPSGAKAVAPGTASSIVNGFIATGTSLLGYFNRQPPAPLAVPTVGAAASAQGYQQGFQDAIFSENQGPNTASVEETDAAFAVAQDPFGQIF